MKIEILPNPAGFWEWILQTGQDLNVIRLVSGRSFDTRLEAELDALKIFGQECRIELAYKPDTDEAMAHTVEYVFPERKVS